MSKLGLGVMINMLGSNEGTVEAINASIGKKIVSIALVDNSLRFALSDGSNLSLRDDGQSCCEHRYMSTDDDLSYYVGAELLGFELKDAPSIGDDEVHEVQFLDVRTSKGVFTMSNHNEHNGYYGGFWIVAHREAP